MGFVSHYFVLLVEKMTMWQHFDSLVYHIEENGCKSNVRESKSLEKLS